MNVNQLIIEYFASQTNDASILIPLVGRLRVKTCPGYMGRDPYTGQGVEVPKRSAIVFSRLKDGKGVINDHFEGWFASSFQGSPTELRRWLEELSASVILDLKQKRRSELEGIGTISLKARPPRWGRDAAHRKPVILPARTTLTFKPHFTLTAAVNSNAPAAHTHDNIAPIGETLAAPYGIPDGLSSFNLETLPPPAQLWRVCQSLAVLALCNNQRGTYLAVSSLEPSLSSRLDDASISYASMSNGHGDSCELFFIEGGGALVQGFAHDSPMASWNYGEEPWPGTYDGLPHALEERLFHDYLEDERVSFCLWYVPAEARWQKGKISQFPNVPSADPDGSGYIFDYFPLTASAWMNSESCTESPPPLEVVQQIYEHRALTHEMVREINPNAQVDMKEIEEMGYPVA